MGERLPAELHSGVEAGYKLSINAATKLVGLGDECDVWRTDTSKGTLVVRISPSWRTKVQLEWSHSLLAFVATQLPEAIAPLAGSNGTTAFMWQEHPVSVYPWVEGEQLRREDRRACDAAAGLLGRLHNAMLLWPEGLMRTVREFTPMEREPTPDLKDPDLDEQLSELFRQPEAVRGPIHGDYYPRNLICRDQRIVGVIDWDDSRIDLLAQELAWAVWEFAQDPSEADLHVEHARRFLAAYRRAGGPVPSDENRYIVPLIRKRLREEVDQAEAWVARGAAIDREYTNREIEAFHKLRGVNIEW